MTYTTDTGVTYATPDEAVRAAAEAIRAANHLTGNGPGGKGWEHAADTKDVVSSVTVALQRLPQLLEQTRGVLAAAAAAGRLDGDAAGGPDAPAAAIAAVQLLEQTVGQAAAVADRAFAATARVSGTLTDDLDDDQDDDQGDEHDD